MRKSEAGNAANRGVPAKVAAESHLEVFARVLQGERLACHWNPTTSKALMDVVFRCPNCKQELAADASLSGTEIQCPSCNVRIAIPAADPANVRTLNPIATSAAAKEEKHFVVPVHDEPTEMLIRKPARQLEVAAKDEEKRIRIKTIRRTDCIEVGHDRFDEVVTEFLGKVGHENIVSINTFNYTNLDIGTQKLMTEFGVLIVYKG